MLFAILVTYTLIYTEEVFYGRRACMLIVYCRIQSLGTKRTSDVRASPLTQQVDFS